MKSATRKESPPTVPWWCAGCTHVGYAPTVSAATVQIVDHNGTDHDRVVDEADLQRALLVAGDA